MKVWNEDGMLEKFRYLPECDLVTQPPAEPEKLDAFVALDTSVKNRLGSVLNAAGRDGCVHQHGPPCEQHRVWRSELHRPDRPGDGTDHF